jgi:ribose transport system permease protein
MIATASLLPLVVGDFDLSVGYVACTSSVVFALLVGKGHGTIVAILAALASGLGVGIVNGVITIWVGVNSFITTLATGTILGGIDLYVTGGQVLFQGIPQGLVTMGSGYWERIPNDIVFAIVLLAVVSYILQRTPVGRAMYATGLGRDAARLSGVKTAQLRMAAFVCSGLVCAGAGLVELGLVGSASVTIGPDFLLPALAACFLGTTTSVNGRFNLFGATVAIFLIAVGVTGLEQLGVPTWVEPIFDGVALLTAVSLTVLSQRARSRRLA